MRALVHSALLVLAGACEREDLAPGMLEPPAPAPRCGDGVADDATPCLASIEAEIPYAHEFLRHVDTNGDGERELFSVSQFFEVSYPVRISGTVDSGELKSLPSFEIKNHDIYRPAAVDFDGDGRVDLAGASAFWYAAGDTFGWDIRMVLWRNWGDFQFEKVGYTHGSTVRPTFAAGDIDGDDLPDLLCMAFPGSAFVWAHVAETDTIEHVGGIEFEALDLVGDPQLAAADYNGDAHADFVLTDATGRAWWIVGGPVYQLTLLDPQPSPVLAPDSQSVLARDFDGDGMVDLAAANIPDTRDGVHTISLALGRPNGRFAALASFPAAHPLTALGKKPFDDAPRLAHLGLFDLDGSGQLALVYAHTKRPELVIHPRIAETRGGAPVVVPLDFPANSLFVDDFEDDGVDAIYVTLSDILEVEPSTEHPDGMISTHYLVRFTPDP